ncbi:MAG: VOC family protein [Bacteroidales bacterium]
MNLEHIAISVNHKDEIKDFYIDILGMEHVRSFELNHELVNDIFGFHTDIPVFLIKKGDLTLEIFVAKQDQNKRINHICFSVQNREELINKVQQKSYELIRIKRTTHDLIFVKDKSGNIFEIKNN